MSNTNVYLVIFGGPLLLGGGGSVTYWLPWLLVNPTVELYRPGNKHKMLDGDILRSWCPIDSDIELRNIQDYVYCSFQ